jgi:Uma2 family endonuclease
VLSESNTTEEINQKLREFFGSGTRLAWVIDPRRRTVAVYHGPGDPTRILEVADILNGEQVVPGFTMPVTDLFRNVPPLS